MGMDWLLIPVVSGLIGWGTNALAIKMLFLPLTRRGVGWLSWQGIMPAHAQRMATVCVELMTSKLIDTRALFRRIEPTQVASILGPTLQGHAQDIVESVLAARFPRLWRVMPEAVKARARERLEAEIPVVVDKLMHDLNEDLDAFLDVKALVVGAFVRDRALLNEFFWRCGEAEFRFISISGLLFGTLLGLPIAVLWVLAQPGWLLPITGLLVGWVTNWLALKMIFEPVEPRQVGPFRWQGLFLKRQPEVSEAYAAFFTERILHPRALINAVLEGPAADRLVLLVQRYAQEAVDSAAHLAKPVASLTMGSQAWDDLKDTIADRLAVVVPAELDRLEDYAGEALDLQGELEANLKGLPSQDFEQVLRPVFREDETTLIAVGAFLGGLAGVVQLLLLGAA